MKAKDTWATWEAALTVQRQRITEQAGCPMIRFAVDDEVCLLSYSYLTRAECHIQNNHYQIIALWPGFKVTIEGYHLDQLANLLGEHRLHSVTLLSDMGEERQEGRPYLERMTFSDT
jgi:hypothetical protein